MVKREAVLGWLASIQRLKAAPFVFILPFLFGISAKLKHSKLWFGDYQAVACAGLKAQAGQPIYTMDLQCHGMHPSVYVYIPIVAKITAAIEHFLSEPGLCALYLFAFVASLAALVAVPLRLAPGSWRDKMPFLVFVSGSAVMWGNIAVILHALVLGAALVMEVSPWLFIAFVACAAAVKPVFLTYLVLLLLADMPFWRRIGLCAIGAAAGLAPTILFVLTDPVTSSQWAQLLSHFVYEVTPGSGFYGWLAMVGLRGDTVFAQGASLVFTLVLTGAAVAIAERLKLSARERLWFGLSVAGLLIPRIMSQDVFLVGPGLVLLARRAAAASNLRLMPQTPWIQALLRHGPHILWGLCVVTLFVSMIQNGRYSTSVAFLGFSLYVIGLGAGLSGQALGRAAGWLRDELGSGLTQSETQS